MGIYEISVAFHIVDYEKCPFDEMNLLVVRSLAIYFEGGHASRDLNTSKARATFAFANGPRYASRYFINKNEKNCAALPPHYALLRHIFGRCAIGARKKKNVVKFTDRAGGGC